MNVPFSFEAPPIDISYCRFGAEALDKLLKTFEAQIEGVVDSEDIEYVHKMRVGSRRLRATLPLFEGCFPKKKFKRWLKEVKKVTRFLGEARDLDVQISFMEKYLKESNGSSEDSGMMLLLKSHKNRRAKVQTTVVKGLDVLKDSAVLPEMETFCEKTLENSAQTQFNPSAVKEHAYWLISSRIDDLLEMDEYVYQENDALKHHETRIRAKWLRYTMEAFSPLYENELSTEIEVIKNFQDVLGEMHDCDVWIDYIPKFITETKIKCESINEAQEGEEIEQGLLKFLDYVAAKRKNGYGQFVSLWEEKKQTNFFGDLKETISNGLIINEAKLKEFLSKPDLKIGVISDIHANLHALEAVFQDSEKRGVNFFLNAGDLVGFGPFPNEVLELLHSKKGISIVGNFDLEVVMNKAEDEGEKKLAVKFAKEELSRLSEDYICSLPHEIQLEVAGKNLLMVHGSPESIKEHIYHDTPDKRLKELAQASDADLIIVGHSHEQFHREIDGVSFVNPGSVGRPGDGNPQAAYAILSFNPFSVELLRINYDVEATADSLRRKMLPESFSQMLLRGVSLDIILKEDKIRKESIVQNCREMVDVSKEVSKAYWPDSEHYEQVRKLALCCFDGLSCLHKLEERERCWLECAAILHDIGLSKSTGGHNKQSLTLILNDVRLPFTSSERRIIGSIARYHRKGLPKKTNYNLASLDQMTISKINMLSSLLRIADALDYTHQSVVKNIDLKVSYTEVTIDCIVCADSRLEQQALNKKKNLFEKIFKRKLVSLWLQK